MSWYAGGMCMRSCFTGTLPAELGPPRAERLLCVEVRIADPLAEVLLVKGDDGTDVAAGLLTCCGTP